MVDIFKPINGNYDEMIRECFKKNKNSCISFWLVGSYCYYLKNESLFKDETFDKLSRWMYDNYDSLEHEHKSLITKDMLKAGSGFNLKESDYPLRVKVTADMFIRGLWSGKHS